MVAFTDGRIDEASSAAMSVVHANVLYTCNDENTTPHVFGVSTVTGDTVIDFSWANGGSITDPEAICVDNQGRLWYADIGDNDGNRDNCAIFMRPEPGLGTGQGALARTKYPIKYVNAKGKDDGAKNAECFLIHPVTQARYIVTKKAGGNGRLYLLPAALQSGVKNKCVRQPQAMPSDVSDGTFTLDGRFVLFRREGHNTIVFVHDATSWALVDTVSVPSQVKPEGITMARDGLSFWITSEGAGAAFYNVALPSAYWPWQSAPSTGGSTPAPGPTPNNPCG